MIITISNPYRFILADCSAESFFNIGIMFPDEFIGYGMCAYTLKWRAG